MTQNYGGSFAQRMIDEGRFDDAIAEATRAAERDPADPEPIADRAQALASLGRFAAAVTDLERALALDVHAQVLERDFVDDGLFSALLGEARAMAVADVPAAIARLQRYREVLPRGRHAADVETWAGRLRGDDKDAIIVKEYGAG